jgi:hypothetical protein
MSTNRAVAATLVVGAALLVPAVGIAALPKPKTATIKPLTSIDGVSLGMAKARVVSQWGVPVYPNGDSACGITSYDRGQTCVWFGRDAVPTLPPEGGVVHFTSAGKVCHVSIQAGVGLRPPNRLVITRLKGWKTTARIGLGSSIAAAKRAHGGQFLGGRGLTQFFFGTGTPPNQRKVVKIALYRKPCRTSY